MRAPAAILAKAPCLPWNQFHCIPKLQEPAPERRTKSYGWIIPKTPAEVPKSSPPRGTKLRMLLIRSRVFDTASGLLAPSWKPQAPPRARPGKRFRACGQVQDNKTGDKVRFGQVRLDAKIFVEYSIDREKHGILPRYTYLCRSRGRHSSPSSGLLRCQRCQPPPPTARAFSFSLRFPFPSRVPKFHSK